MNSSRQSTENLKNLADKRHALESLINITASIHEQQKGLLELSAASDAKQDFPFEMMSHINLLKEKIGMAPVTEILQKLEKIEKVTEANLTQIIQLVEVEPEDLNHASNELNSNQFSVDEFIDRIASFKRHTQTSIGLRLILKERNVAIAPFRLPIPQAELNHHIRTLKQKEKRCVKRVRKDIVEIIKDSKKIMDDPSISEQMRECIGQIKMEMEENLNHLDNGGKIDELPTKIEHHVLESEIELQVELYDADNNEDDNNQTVDQEVYETTVVESKNDEAEPLTFWQIFKLWLASPMSVSWSSLKQTHSKKD
ncbi:MAG: hypothetical protein ACPGJI_05570 [Kangiellaceae bacterium]